MAVAVEIRERHRLRTRAGGGVVGGRERAIAVVEQNRDVVGGAALVGGHQVGDAITVEIADDDRAGAGRRRVHFAVGNRAPANPEPSLTCQSMVRVGLLPKSVGLSLVDENVTERSAV